MTPQDNTLVRCHCCAQIAEFKTSSRCQRCASVLHYRSPNASTRSWAFSIAASALFIPANTLPIISIGLLAQPEPATILGGVNDLYNHGNWFLAALVFFASFVIPFAKILALWHILLNSQNITSPPIKLTKLYWLTESVGRWSMVDIFVVAILFALVQFGSFAEVLIGPAAWCFGAVVILTMIAADSFDPRILWDHYNRHKDARN